ncbi:chemotaxis protein CheA [Novosphingobium mangrovi (ex Huang et al. 2023)]|uniref:Chemotaxis protein CheA n=1 Tax=Novosphingobium mangrovi (ex Huang et al. 2023) TaxID=2976432 RepID=A0ABT2I4T2_9SPHN|nr:chemotaxis protein CheA [Novosphingobium mangrovi (ex Huang et al. 2023)]MCT2399819.1 chemotaxis protein CheA [Novosphingobium mangrovi (ex Huang et al. 2023)]
MSPEEIQQIFFAECEESLAAAESGLAACQAGTHDSDTVNAVFRAVHSIKGGAGAFGYSALQAYTHTFETLLSDVREGLVAIEGQLVDLLLRALDTLADHVEAARGGGDAPADAALITEMEGAMAGNAGGVAPSAVAPEPEPEPEPETSEDAGDDLDLDALLDDLTSGFTPAASQPEEAPAAQEKRWKVHLRPRAGAMRNGSEPLLMLRDIVELGGTCVRCDVSHVPPLDAFDVAQGYLGWTFAMPAAVSEEAVRDIFDFIGDDCALALGEGEDIPDVQIVETAPPPKPAPIVPAPAAAATPAPAAPAARPAATLPAAAPEEPPKAAEAKPQATDKPAAATAAPAAGQSIRIDLFKLDRLIDLVGELVIAQAMLVQRLDGAGITATEELGLLETLTRDIQESAMSIRAQPIASVFSRVPRILRDLAASTGKHVKLDVFGETTELDKTVIERLGEPLTHLIRNAVDHGIESAEDRIAAGKPPEGTLTLSAEHRSGRIVISIEDDGAGINRERVLAKAIEKGIVSADAQLSAEEIDNLIFAPGFSTAQVVSNISGRGVGMDVVRQNVKDLGGRITIDSTPGKGTAFILTLPLTLAISDGMIVDVGDQTLVVPLTHVVESLRPGEADIHGLGSSRAMLNVRGRFIPIIALKEALGAPNGATSPDEGVLIVVDTESAGQAALLVNDICDQRQFVIKSLATNFRPVEGVAGATILGDGRVALIVDVDGLVACALPAGERQAA